MAATVRQFVLKIRLSGTELEAVRARAAGEPLAEWLRRLSLSQAPPRRRRVVRERPLHPQAAELTRHVVWASNILREIEAALADAGQLNPESLAILMRIDAYLRRVLKVAQC